VEYATVRTIHMACAGISITLFAARGGMQLAGVNWRRWRWLRIAPHLNDTLLLGAAIALALVSHQYPIAQGWLSAKVLALLAYIGLGRLALLQSASVAQQRFAFAAALATVAYIVGVAMTRSTTLGLA
jgi:uncharacterized membrane protein SirB2